MQNEHGETKPKNYTEIRYSFTEMLQRHKTERITYQNTSKMSEQLQLLDIGTNILAWFKQGAHSTVNNDFCG